MELLKIERLLEKYFEANTSLEEENTLKEFFAKETVPDHLIQYKGFFGAFEQVKKEVHEPEIKLPKKKFKLNWIAAAAVILFMLSVFSYQQYEVHQQKEAQKAFLETQKALRMISQNLNKGNRAVAQLEYFDKAQQTVFKND
jgi:hypothetical protein